jgi:hypothetical protein
MKMLRDCHIQQPAAQDLISIRSSVRIIGSHSEHYKWIGAQSLERHGIPIDICVHWLYFATENVSCKHLDYEITIPNIQCIDFEAGPNWKDTTGEARPANYVKFVQLQGNTLGDSAVKIDVSSEAKKKIRPPCDREPPESECRPCLLNRVNKSLHASRRSNVVPTWPNYVGLFPQASDRLVPAKDPESGGPESRRK